MKSVKFLVGLGAVLSLFVLAGCSNLSKENYEKLETGMEMAEIEDIIGSADSCEEALGAQACVWGDEEKNIKVKLVAGKAVFFSNKGLQ